MTRHELIQRQSLEYEAKIYFSAGKIRQFIEQCGRDTVAQVSGLDSAVMLHLIRKNYPSHPAIFINTGIEDPTVVSNALATENMTTIKPEMTFHEVVTIHGYPAVSKQVARALSDIQNPTARNENTIRLRLTGEKSDGTKGAGASILPKKYFPLIDCGFKFSDKCCYFLKQKPADAIHKKMGLAPFVGTLAEDSEKRARAYLKTGCNNFGAKLMSKPLSIWSRQDVYRYAVEENITIPECYGTIERMDDGTFCPTGEKHTGCQTCLFGIAFDPGRIERLKDLYPARYKYCMDTLNYKELIPLILNLGKKEKTEKEDDRQMDLF